jgi:uncharacterized protein
MDKEQTHTAFENLQLSFQNIPSIQQIALQPIQSNYKKVISYTWLIVYSIILFAISLAYFFIDDFKTNNTLVLIVISCYAVVVLFTFLYINVEFKFRSFAIRQYDVVYKSGWIFQKIEALPFTKIQHSTVSQNIISRKFNLANITFYTAASHDGDVTIHGLLFNQAEQIKDFIMQQNNQLHGKIES